MRKFRLFLKHLLWTRHPVGHFAKVSWFFLMIAACEGMRDS